MSSISNFTKSYSNVSAVKNQTYDLLIAGKSSVGHFRNGYTWKLLCLVCLKLFVTKVRLISYEIAKRVIKVKYISHGESYHG